MRFFDIRDVDQLERLTGRPVAASERQGLQRALEAYPARLGEHLLSLAARSEAVARQYLPDPRELDGGGEEQPFVGLLSTGVDAVQRLYPDRCVVLLSGSCPGHCRFCFRRHAPHRARPDPDTAELDRAAAYIAGDPRLTEVLVTGGEPALRPRRLAHLLQALRRVPHVGPVRVACRSLVAAPELVSDELAGLLARHHDPAGLRPLEVASHINHPDELDDAAHAALQRLQRRGLHVYNQAVLLRGVNDGPDALLELSWQLRRRGVESYALFFPEPVRGAAHLRPRLSRALELKARLRRGASGRGNPRLIVTTRIGKLEPGVDSVVAEREPDGVHLWFRTPYTLSGLRALEPGFELPRGCRVHGDGAGTIEVRYLDGGAAAGPSA